jgi:hypothetical protein
MGLKPIAIVFIIHSKLTHYVISNSHEHRVERPGQMRNPMRHSFQTCIAQKISPYAFSHNPLLVRRNYMAAILPLYNIFANPTKTVTLSP